MTDQPLAFSHHDHSQCTGDLMAHAVATCEQAGVRLTPVRRRTLEILAESHKALGAYEVLERLRAEGFGSQPPVAYRALDFLVENGLAHKVRRLNAFAACAHPGTQHRPVFFICAGCNAVAETPVPAMAQALDQAAAQIGFTVERANFEALGRCPECSKC